MRFFHSFSKSEKLRAGMLIVLFGLFLAQFLTEANYFLFLSGLFLILAIAFQKTVLTLLTLFFLSVFYGQGRYYFEFVNDSLLSFENKNVFITGEITSFLDEREKNNRTFLTVSTVDKKIAKGRILFIFPKNLKILYGNKVSFRGKIEKPKNFQGFNYEAYLKRFGSTAIVRNFSNFKIISNDGGIGFLRGASRVRGFFTKNLEKSLPLPHNRIATGLLLGVKNALPPPVSDDFKRAGLTHLLVVSGFNVSVVVFLITFIFKKLGRRLVFFVSVISIAFFVAMTGGDAPVLRAAIMGGLAGGAAAFGQLNNAKNIVLGSAVLMGLFSPAVIQNDVGFFLSFSATVGIILFARIFENWFRFLPQKFEIRQIVSVLMAAQVSVFPILGFYFGEFPLIGFVSNLFSEPLVPLAMAFSTISIIGGLAPVLIAKIVAIPAFIILEILVTIAHNFGKIPPIPIAKNVAILMQFLVLLAFLHCFFKKN